MRKLNFVRIILSIQKCTYLAMRGRRNVKNTYEYQGALLFEEEVWVIDVERRLQVSPNRLHA